MNMSLLTTKLSDTRLELFSLVWLHDDPKESQDTEQKLRSIVNQLIHFKDVESCQKYIERESKLSRIIMVVSGRLGSEIVSQIHNLRQVVSIYVYCMNKEYNKKWADKFSKVKAVVVRSDELISRIKADHKKQKMIEEPLSINIFNTSKSTGGVNGQFIFFQVLIDCLLRLKSTSNDTKELLDRCKEQYNGNTEELNKIHEFEREYSSNKVLWWYTRDSFFYKTLNAALRNQDIHLIFLFRAFISDIQQHLKKDQINNALKVYRTQLISKEELKSLKKYCDQFISINSFFSTSTDYKQALHFLDAPDYTNDLVAVLFEIDADPEMVITKPFADISSYSEYPEESEVLFMTGSIFRLKSVEHQTKTNIYVIQMMMCSENELDSKQVLTHMKKQLGHGETNLRILSRFLAEMGQPVLAEKYLVRCLDQLSPTHPSRGELYEELGKLASQAGNLDKSMEWRQKALDFQKQNNLTIPNEKKLDRLPSPYKGSTPEKNIDASIDNNRCSKCHRTYRPGTPRLTNAGQSYHETCFQCDSCFKPIGTKQYILKDEKNYCVQCYEQYFATKCARCHQVIKQRSFVYKNQSWHPECFACTHCGKPIADSSFPSRNDHPYCHSCFDQLFAKKCCACQRPISGPGKIHYVTFEDRHWHTDCFRCQRCRIGLDRQDFCKLGQTIVCPDCAKS